MKQSIIDFLGILWVLLFTSLTLISLVLNGYYNPFVDNVSQLGVGNGSIYFNIGMIIAGYIGSIMVYERYKNFNKLLTIIGIFAMNTLALTGWFPLNTNLHGLFTGLMFGGMGIFFLLYAILLRSRSMMLMLVTYLICSFICVPLAEWIVFITVNIWVGIKSTKFYYKKRSIYINL